MCGVTGAASNKAFIGVVAKVAK